MDTFSYQVAEEETSDEYLGDNEVKRFFPLRLESGSPGAIIQACPACHNVQFRINKHEQSMRMEGGAGINVKYQYVCAGCGLLMEGKEEILMYKSDQHFVKGALVGKLWMEDIRFFSRRKWLAVIREKEANLTKKIRKQILGK